MRKFFAIVGLALTFGIYFFDELYKLGSLEWVPEILAPLVMVTSYYLWNPERFRKKPKDEPGPTIGESR